MSRANAPVWALAVGQTLTYAGVYYAFPAILPDLLAELRQAGVQAGTLSFGSWAEGQSAPSKDDWTKNPDNNPAPTPLASPSPVHRPTPAVTGLNLRL